MFRLCSHPVSVATIKLCCCSMKAAINNIKRVPIKLYLQEQTAGSIWPTDCSLPPSGICSKSRIQSTHGQFSRNSQVELCGRFKKKKKNQPQSFAASPNKGVVYFPPSDLLCSDVVRLSLGPRRRGTLLLSLLDLSFHGNRSSFCCCCQRTFHGEESWCPCSISALGVEQIHQ